MSVVQFCQLSMKPRHSFCLCLYVCQWRGMLHRLITIADSVTGLLSYLCTYHSCDINTCGPLQIMLFPNYSESTLWNFSVRDPILWSWILTIRLTAMVSMSSLQCRMIGFSCQIDAYILHQHFLGTNSWHLYTVFILDWKFRAENRISCKRSQVDDYDKAAFRVPVCSVHAIFIPSAKGGCCFLKWYRRIWWTHKCD